MYKAAERVSKTAVVIASSISLSPLYGKLEPVEGKAYLQAGTCPGQSDARRHKMSLR